jgi:hypothetical protein
MDSRRLFSSSSQDIVPRLPVSASDKIAILARSKHDDLPKGTLSRVRLDRLGCPRRNLGQQHSLSQSRYGWANVHFWQGTFVNPASRSITVDILFLSFARSLH